jgi:hypothetical protein
VILVPLAMLVLGLLLWGRLSGGAPDDPPTSSGTD